MEGAEKLDGVGKRLPEDEATGCGNSQKDQRVREVGGAWSSRRTGGRGSVLPALAPFTLCLHPHADSGGLPERAL